LDERVARLHTDYEAQVEVLHRTFVREAAALEVRTDELLLPSTR
jgi:hypothetical protein